MKNHPATKRLIGLIAALLLCGLLAAFAYQLPFIRDQVTFRLSELQARLKYALSPPEQAVFTPDPTLAAMVEGTMAALAPTANAANPAATEETSSKPHGSPTPRPTPSAPTAVPTPLPERVLLTGIKHEYQQWNNCGPANLAMALSFWGWAGDQRPIAKFTKPNPRDKNVMPYELADFVTQETGLQVLVRVGGDLGLLKRFIAAGFPVIVEKGLEVPGVEGWMGHYQVLTGYDDARATFNAYDSYQGDFSNGQTLLVSYQTVDAYWRHFNQTYLVIFPAERKAEVHALLGEDLDQERNFLNAAQRASDDIFSTTGRDQFFAWFNRATNLMRLQDFGGAAAAYDQAFQLYASLDPEERPWRMLWYQTGPYWAYYYTGRYWDVISLATQTLEVMSEPVLEESFYWRGLAKESLGDVAGAIADYQQSVEVHPGFGPALDQLERLGVSR